MRITKKEIRKYLKDGHGIWKKATAMTSGSHEYWLVNIGTPDEDVKVFGRGVDWVDQNEETAFTVEEAIDHLYRNRRWIYEVAPHEPYDFECEPLFEIVSS